MLVTNKELSLLFSDFINPNNFYTRDEIMDVSKKLEFDAYGNCDWELYNEVELTLNNKNLVYKYYTKKQWI